MRAISFFVPGLPGTKGSARAFVVGKRAVITNAAGQKAKSWAAKVSDEAACAGGGVPLAPHGPVRVDLTFYLPRPKSHYLPVTKTRREPVLREDAPRHVASKPDGDKMERCTWDALTSILFGDDAQIAEWSGRKLYADPHAVGAEVRIETLSE